MITSTTDPKCYDLTGLSTQDKPLDLNIIGNGSKFTELDTGKVFYLNAADPEHPVWLEYKEI